MLTDGAPLCSHWSRSDSAQVGRDCCTVRSRFVITAGTPPPFPWLHTHTHTLQIAGPSFHLHIIFTRCHRFTSPRCPVGWITRKDLNFSRFISACPGFGREDGSSGLGPRPSSKLVWTKSPVYEFVYFCCVGSFHNVRNPTKSRGPGGRPFLCLQLLFPVFQSTKRLCWPACLESCRMIPKWHRGLFLGFLSFDSFLWSQILMANNVCAACLRSLSTSFFPSSSCFFLFSSSVDLLAPTAWQQGALHRDGKRTTGKGCQLQWWLLNYLLSSLLLRWFYYLKSI